MWSKLKWFIHRLWFDIKHRGYLEHEDYVYYDDYGSDDPTDDNGLDDYHDEDGYADDYDVCREVGCSMRAVYIDGEECEQCIVCGAIDC